MIGLYLRVSSEKQEKKYSITSQREKGITFANSINENYVIYQEAESAKGMIFREELKRLFSDIESNIIQKVWVVNIDRVARNLEDALFIKKLFLDNKVELYVDGKYYDFSNSIEKLSYNIQSAISEFENDKRSEKTKSGMLTWRNSGNQTFTNLYGYESKFDEKGNKIYCIVEEEAEVIKEIYDYFFQNYSFNRIAKTLNKRMIEPPGIYRKSQKVKTKWSIMTVIHIMEKPIYTGFYYDSNNELIKSNKYEAIIPLEQFQKSRELWDIRKIENPTIQFKKSNSQCGGIIKCSKCNEGFVHINLSDKKKGTEKYSYYRCRHKKGCDVRTYIKAEHIDNLFSLLYYFTFSNQKEVEDLLRLKETEINKKKEITVRDKERFEKALTIIEEKKNRLLNLVQVTEVDYNDIGSQMKKLKDEETEIKNRLNAVNREIKIIEEQYEKILNEFRENSLLKFIHDKPVEKRAILKKLIDKALIEDSTIFVEFITGKNYKIDIPKNPHKPKGKNIYHIKVINNPKRLIQDFIFNAEKNVLRYGEGEGDYKLVTKWVKDTEKAIKEGKGIAPLST